jgi:zinc transporter 1/2/3
MSVFSLFLIELLALRYATFSGLSSAIERESSATTTATSSDDGKAENLDLDQLPVDRTESAPALLGESYAGQLTALFILEFGVILHSLFIGLTLAVSGNEFKTLYIVLVFHQMFEGLGLGARLSALKWPKSKRFTPHVMAIAYGLSTPLAVGIGLGVRNTYPPGSQTTLIVNGVFDSISAGILLYTGLVELIAHEFLFNKTLSEESALVVFGAFGYMVCGAGRGFSFCSEEYV